MGKLSRQKKEEWQIANQWLTSRSGLDTLHMDLILANTYLTGIKGFPGSWDGKESAYNAGDLGSIPGSGKSPGEGNGNPLQYSCLENPMDGGAWWATVHWVTKSRTRLSDFTFIFISLTSWPLKSPLVSYMTFSLDTPEVLLWWLGLCRSVWTSPCESLWCASRNFLKDRKAFQNIRNSF